MATISEISAGSAGMTVLGKDTTGGGTTSTTETKIGEVSVAGGAVGTYVVIKVLFKGQAVGYNNAYRRPQLDIKVGESGSEASVADSPFDQVAQGTLTGTAGGVNFTANVGSLEYYYEPTVDEKANGFNVQVFGKINTSGSDPGGTKRIDVYQVIVMGL